MSRTKHHQKYGKNYSSKKYFVVPVGASGWYHFVIINSKYTTLKQKRQYFNTDDNWYKKMPSYCIKKYITVPKRSKCKNWEKQLLKLQDIEDCSICPDFGNKPYIYSW